MFLLAFLGVSSFAQTYDKVKNAVLLRKAEDAKKELDKILADPKLKEKDKAEGAYWTFAIYSIFYADPDLTVKYPGADSISLQALYQYEQKDTSLKALKENNAITHDIDNLRSTGFNNGAKFFNQHLYEQSYHGFALAQKVDEVMKRHGFFAKNFVDTNTILYGAYAAQNSGRMPEAVANYRLLADGKVRIEDSKKFETNFYAYMLDYFLKNNDQDDFKKYMPVVKSIYPEFGPQLEQMETQYATSNTALTELVTKYKQEVAGLTETKIVAYAEAFAQPDKKEFDKLDSITQLQVKLTAADAFSRAYGLGMATAPAGAGGDNIQVVNVGKSSTDTKPYVNNTGIYAYNSGIIYYNVFQDLDQRFFELRGSDAALKVKRDATEKLEHLYADSAIIWFTNSYNILKAKTDIDKREKSLLLNDVKDLANIYQWKEDKARGVTPKDVDKYEALYKQFDAETDKYSK